MSMIDLAPEDLEGMTMKDYRIEVETKRYNDLLATYWPLNDTNPIDAVNRVIVSLDSSANPPIEFIDADDLVLEKDTETGIIVGYITYTIEGDHAEGLNELQLTVTPRGELAYS